MCPETQDRGLRIMLGAGGIRQEGFISTERSSLNLLDESTFSKYCSPNSVEVFFAEHLWEHLTIDEGERAARNCLTYLRPGGTLRIAVPDGLHPSPSYIEWVRPGGSGLGAMDHRVLFSLTMLQALLERAGFKDITPLEWWDEKGQFHHTPWSQEKGLVRRSRDYDLRNNKAPLSFTSLIVDATKTPA